MFSYWESSFADEVPAYCSVNLITTYRAPVATVITLQYSSNVARYFVRIEHHLSVSLLAVGFTAFYV